MDEREDLSDILDLNDNDLEPYGTLRERDSDILDEWDDDDESMDDREDDDSEDEEEEDDEMWD